MLPDHLRVLEVRRPREKPVTVLLERWEDREARTPGWIQRPDECDWVRQTFVRHGQELLLPFPLLRAAWLKHGREWIELAEAGRDGFALKRPRDGSEVVLVPLLICEYALAGAVTVRAA